MNTVHDIFSKYGWRQLQLPTTNTTNEVSFIKNNEKQLDVFTIKLTEENTFHITVPLVNSNFSYTNTISDIQEVKSYIETHLNNFQ